MARIVLGSYMVRYPLGGMMSWALQYLVGFQRLGHDVYFVEKAGYAGSCFDPSRNAMTDDCSYGTAVLNGLLRRFELQDRWCFVDSGGRYHGMSGERIEEVFRTADLFVDMGTHGAWMAEAQGAGARVLVDGEPGFAQMKMEKKRAAGEPLPDYDFYFSTGVNIGTPRTSAPTGGHTWGTLFHPVVCDLFPVHEPPAGAPFTTVMNWQSYEPLEYNGKRYGHKDVEFQKFIDLPRRTKATLELAISGKNVPRAELEDLGWRLRDAHGVTVTFDSFAEYLRHSAGEFSVCKNGFVATHSGWFSDRGAAYLASGRPVVQEETGFSEHLPCGKGLFAVRNADEAAEAIAKIVADYAEHSKAARRIAEEHLAAERVLGRFLKTLNVK